MRGGYRPIDQDCYFGLPRALGKYLSIQTIHVINISISAAPDITGSCCSMNEILCWPVWSFLSPDSLPEIKNQVATGQLHLPKGNCWPKLVLAFQGDLENFWEPLQSMSLPDMQMAAGATLHSSKMVLTLVTKSWPLFSRGSPIMWNVLTLRAM